MSQNGQKCEHCSTLSPYILDHHGQIIQISTNMPGIGLVIRDGQVSFNDRYD